MKYSHFVLSVAMLCFADDVFAHDYWLQPSEILLSPNKQFNVRLFVGDHLNSDIERPYQPKRTPRFELVNARSKQKLSRWAKSGVKPLLTMRLKKPGGHWLFVDRDASLITLKADKFNNYLKHEGLTHILKKRKKAGETNKPGREKYSRCLKCFLQVGEHYDAAWKKRSGQKLEIIPKSNPGRLRVGDTLKVHILFDGKPLAGAAFFALHKHKGKVHSQDLHTDKSGLGTVNFPHAGHYVIRLVHMRRCANDARVDWESFWGAMTVGVR